MICFLNEIIYYHFRDFKITEFACIKTFWGSSEHIRIFSTCILILLGKSLISLRNATEHAHGNNSKRISIYGIY